MSGKARTAGDENLAGARSPTVTLVVSTLTWESVTIRSTKPLTLAHHMLANTRTLIRSLQNRTLDKRYSRIEVVNRDPATGGARDADRGSFSVIFRAFDDVTQRYVAIKFFDPSQRGWGMDYRMMLFSREADILQRLQGKSRCLQLVQPISTMAISVDDEDGNSVAITCGYFVMEWLDGSIEAYFYNHGTYDAAIKLALFRSMVLGVFALHREHIAHRDLKYDNLMSRRDGGDVVPVDLGTAIDLTSAPIGTPIDYSQPVGALPFAPLEAQCGLAHLRELAVYADIHALGCMLHDLFNTDFYFVRLLEDPGFQQCYSTCKLWMARLLAEGASDEQLLEQWNEIVRLTRNQVSLPSIASDGTSVPNAARDQLNRLMHHLTAVHHLGRLRDLETILRMIDSASRALMNQLVDKRYREMRLVRREYREQRRLENLARFEQAQLEALNRA